MHVSRTQLANANQLLRYRVFRGYSQPDTTVVCDSHSRSTAWGLGLRDAADELRRTAASCVCDATRGRLSVALALASACGGAARDESNASELKYVGFEC